MKNKKTKTWQHKHAKQAATNNGATNGDPLSKKIDAYGGATAFLALYGAVQYLFALIGYCDAKGVFFRDLKMNARRFYNTLLRFCEHIEGVELGGGTINSVNSLVTTMAEAIVYCPLEKIDAFVEYIINYQAFAGTGAFVQIADSMICVDAEPTGYMMKDGARIVANITDGNKIAGWSLVTQDGGTSYAFETKGEAIEFYKKTK